MMTYTTGYYHMPQYKYASTNQHGDRFKRKASKQLNVVRLSCKRDNASDLEDLVVLSHTLNVPVHYDFDENKAYVEIMSADTVRNKT